MNIIFLCLSLSIILILYYPLLVNIPTRNQALLGLFIILTLDNPVLLPLSIRKPDDFPVNHQVISFIRKLTVRFVKNRQVTGKLKFVFNLTINHNI